MARHLLIVITQSKPGQEDEYNRWYTQQHLDDVLRVPGFVAAQRFKLAAQGGASLPAPYLAIYEMETDDPAGAFAALSKATESGAMPISPALETDNLVASVFTPITERKTRSTGSG